MSLSQRSSGIGNLVTLQDLKHELENFAGGILRTTLDEALKEHVGSADRNFGSNVKGHVGSADRNCGRVDSTTAEGLSIRASARGRLSTGPATSKRATRKTCIRAQVSMDLDSIVEENEQIVTGLDQQSPDPNQIRAAQQRCSLSARTSVVAVKQDDKNEMVPYVPWPRPRWFDVVTHARQPNAQPPPPPPPVFEALPLLSAPNATDLDVKVEESETLLEKNGSQVEPAFIPRRSRALAIAESDELNIVVALIVLTNSLLVGYETSSQASSSTWEAPVALKYVDMFSLFFFSTELAIRLSAYGRLFFCNDDMAFNMFDFVLVFNQFFEYVLYFLVNENHESNSSVLRFCRLFRIARVLRVLRTIRLFNELRRLLNSMMQALAPVIWVIILLIGSVYFFSVVIIQMILLRAENGDIHRDFEHGDQIAHFYGSVPRAMLLLFEALNGGVDWDEAVAPLNSDISPFLGFFVCLYIYCLLLMVMNMLSGMVAQSCSVIMHDAMEVEDAVAFRDKLMAHVSEGEVDRDEFMRMLEDPSVGQYFTEAGIDTESGSRIFDIFDLDCNGALNAKELVNSCIRLRRPARSSDVILTQVYVHEILANVVEILNMLQNQAVD